MQFLRSSVLCTLRCHVCNMLFIYMAFWRGINKVTFFKLKRSKNVCCKLCAKHTMKNVFFSPVFSFHSRGRGGGNYSCASAVPPSSFLLFRISFLSPPEFLTNVCNFKILVITYVFHQRGVFCVLLKHFLLKFIFE